MSGRATLRNWLLAFAATAIMAVVCIAYVDRSAASFFDQHLRHTTARLWIERALAPLDLTVAMALLFLLGCGVWASFNRALPLWTRTPRLCSWAASWATLASSLFKRIFGRVQPDPEFLQNHLYGFRLLHGGPHGHSFPSGTATISAAIVLVLCILLPRWRALGILIVALLSIAVILTNYHWVGDVVAGVFLGAFIGWITVQVAMTSERHRSA